MQLIQNKELAIMELKKYKLIANKFQNNITLTSPEMQFLVSFSRKLDTCALSARF